MTEDAGKLDLRILKYKNHIRKNPQKPYGYYCMGKLLGMADRFAEAERYLLQALDMDPGYTAAAIGMVETSVRAGHPAKAAKLYSRYANTIIDGKNIRRLKLVRAVSSLANCKVFSPDSLGLLARIRTKLEFRLLQNVYKKDPGYLLANLLLGMLYLKNGNASDQAIAIFNTCAGMEGLTDSLRWSFVKALARDNPAILQNTEIAGRFERMPSPNCPASYVNTVFSTLTRTGDNRKVRRFSESMPDFEKVLSLSNLWNYVVFNGEHAENDPLVHKSCKKLIHAGWIDRVVAGAVYQIKTNGSKDPLTAEKKILHLFGFPSPNQPHTNSINTPPSPSTRIL